MEIKTYEASASAYINAAPQAVYDLLKDYRVGHPSILPTKYFKSLKIEKGGVGSGTVFVAEMEVMGRKSSLRMEVTEPKPGQLLQEQTADKAVVTQFRLVPEGQGTQLTLHTTWHRKPGFGGWIETLIVPGISRKIYKEELKLITAKFARS